MRVADPIDLPHEECPRECAVVAGYLVATVRFSDTIPATYKNHR